MITSQLILCGQHYPDTKLRQWNHKNTISLYPLWIWIYKLINKILANKFSCILKWLYTTIRCDLSQKCKDGSTYKNQCTRLYTLIEWKRENTIWSSQVIHKKYLTKYNTLLWFKKTLNKREAEGNFLKMIKGIYEKWTANIIFNIERFRLSLYDQSKRHLWVPFLYNIILEVLDSEEREREEYREWIERKNSHRDRKEKVKQSLFADNMILCTGNPKDPTKQKNKK